MKEFYGKNSFRYWRLMWLGNEQSEKQPIDMPGMTTTRLLLDHNDRKSGKTVQIN